MVILSKHERSLLELQSKQLLCIQACSTVDIIVSLITCFLIDSRLGLADHDLAKEAFDLFQQMTIAPDEYSFATMFKICAQLRDTASLEFGKTLLKTMPVKFHRSPILLNSALHMFMQCGDLSGAEQLFSRMDKNVVTFGAMMNGNSIDSCIFGKNVSCSLFKASTNTKCQKKRSISSGRLKDPMKLLSRFSLPLVLNLETKRH